MGMDVFGRKPTSKEGEYFRNNVVVVVSTRGLLHGDCARD